MPNERELDAARRAIWEVDQDEMTYDEAYGDAHTSSSTSEASTAAISHVYELAMAALTAVEGVAETDPHKMLKKALFQIAGTGCRFAQYGGVLTGAGIAYIVYDVRETASPTPKFKRGDRVQKIRGSSWRGPVVGFYSTEFTPVGYCVESENEPGSVQVWPEVALEAMPPRSEKIECLDLHTPGWPDFTYPNGARMFAKDGTMLDDNGNRSIFDDIDEGSGP